MAEEWIGAWWIPGSLDQVGGKLTLDESGVELEVFGSLAGPTEIDMSKGVSLPLREPLQRSVLHGLAGAPVSVISASCSLPLLPPMTGSESWQGDAVVEAHVEPDQAEPAFVGLRMQLDHLPVWARARPPKAFHWFKSGRRDVRVWPHDLGSGRLRRGERVQIYQGVESRSSTLEHRLATPVRISVSEVEPSTWTDLLNAWLQPLQVLLWLATADTSRVQSLEVALNEHDGRPSWAGLRVPLVERSRRSRNLTAHDVIFFVDDIPGWTLGDAVDRWLDIWKELQHVLGPLYARASAPFAYANDRFYSAAAAVEAYHRYCTESDRDRSRLEHRERVKLVEELMDRHAPELRDWAVNAVRPFNRIPLWRRIVEIADVFELLGDELFGDAAEKFARNAEEARHGHAHALGGTGAIQSGADLYFAADALVWLLRACVMVDLGIRLDQVELLILRNEQFRLVARRTRDMCDRLHSAT